MVVPSGVATSTKILPGAVVPFEVRIDAPTVSTVGTAYRLSQTAPGTSGFFSITGRSILGSPFNDPSSGATDAAVTTAPGNLINPDSDVNLGKNTVSLVGIPPANDILVSTITLTSDPATPLGTYVIQPTAGASAVTEITSDPFGNDVPMSGASFTIIVGQTLSVTKSGAGTGTVTADTGLISCGLVCSDIYPGTLVTLTPLAAGGSVFTGWSGACTGAGPCQVTVDAAKSVNANFDLLTFGLSVSKTGAGSGTVTSAPPGINCGATCDFNFVANTVVTLSASASVGSRFTGWSGSGCSGTGICQVTMDAAKAVSANFVPTFDLTVSKTGAGTGTVTSDVGTINCPGTCVNTYDAATVVTLTPHPAAGSRFTGWGGACSGSGACVVTMDAAKSVSANFVLTFVLTVNKSGGGTGLVTSNVGAINCGATCADTYDGGSVVILTAVADPTFVFVGWSGGGCAGTGTCQVTLNANTTVTATFAPTFSLTVNKTGSGTGTVTSDIGGINCGATCSVVYPSGSIVNLTATPTGGSVFTGWSGACTGSGACQVTVDSAKVVTANFIATYLLTVTKAGAGTGTVTSNVGGINCGATCSASYNDGTAVVLTASAGLNSVFTGWSGDCSGTGTCNLTMSAVHNVTATFTPRFLLTVTKDGNGTGTVTSDVGGINCGATCSAIYTSGDAVVLTATPDVVSGSVFDHWSGGGCSGNGTCNVTVTAATTVTATFTDSVPPTTTLLTTPTNPSNQALAQFTFSSNEPGTFQCSLDGAPFTACSSPATYTVDNGVHTFTVRARDLGGNVDPNPPSFRWTAAGIVVVTSIPTLSEWMLALLALMLGGLGMHAHQRRMHGRVSAKSRS